MTTVVNERLFNGINGLDITNNENKKLLKKLYPFDLKKQLTKAEKASFLELAKKPDVYRSLTGSELGEHDILSPEGPPTLEAIMRRARFRLFMQQEYDKIAAMAYSKADAGKTTIISDEDVRYLEDISKIDCKKSDTLKVLQNHFIGLDLTKFDLFETEAQRIKLLAKDKLNDIEIARNRDIDAKKEELLTCFGPADLKVDALLVRSNELHDKIRAKINELEIKIMENERARGEKRDAIKAKGIFAPEPKTEKKELKDLDSDYTALKTAVNLLQQADERLFSPYGMTNRTKIKVERIKARSELLKLKMNRDVKYDIQFEDVNTVNPIQNNTIYLTIQKDKVTYSIRNCSDKQKLITESVSNVDLGFPYDKDLTTLTIEEEQIQLESKFFEITNKRNHTFDGEYTKYDPRNPNIGFAADNREFQDIQLQAEYIEQDINRGEKLLALATNVHNDPKKHRNTLPGSSNFLMKVSALSDVPKQGEFIHSIIRKGSTEIDKEASEGRLEVAVYRGVRLNKGDIKQSKCTTGTNTLCVEQDHTGKITYTSENSPQSTDLQLLALEIAETALLNYKHGDKIELNGSEKDAQLSSMVHAAILILTETDKVYKSIPFDPKCIKNNVVGAAVPSWFGPWNKTFMNNEIKKDQTTIDMKMRLTLIYQGRNDHKKLHEASPPVGIEFKIK